MVLHLIVNPNSVTEFLQTKCGSIKISNSVLHNNLLKKTNELTAAKNS